MKRIFTVLLTCCAAFAYAEDDSFFQETDEKIEISARIPFAAEEPIFEEDDETNQAVAEPATNCDDCDECDCDGCDDGESRRNHDDERDHDRPDEKVSPQLNLAQQLPTAYFPPTAKESRLSYTKWTRYKANFGMEKLFIRFPQKPALSQTSTFLTAYAYDNAVLYSLVGYYPSMGNIDPISWFDSVLYSVDHYPFTLISHVIFQVSNGDWVMDYVAHDYIQNLIIKARAIVTPFNAYTLQCVKPNGMRDYFDYYLDNFLLKCECEPSFR